MLAGDVFLQSTDHNVTFAKPHLRSQIATQETASFRTVTDRLADGHLGVRASQPNGPETRREFDRLAGPPPRPSLHRAPTVREDKGRGEQRSADRPTAMIEDLSGINRNLSDIGGSTLQSPPIAGPIPRNPIEAPLRTPSISLVTFVQANDNNLANSQPLSAPRSTNANRPSVGVNFATQIDSAADGNERSGVTVAGNESAKSNSHENPVDQGDLLSGNDASVDRHREYLSTSSSVAIGTIDSIAIAGHDFRRLSNHENDEPWEVDIEMLDQLRQIVIRSGPAKIDAAPHRSDPLFANDFNNGSGWIDVAFDGEMPIDKVDIEPAIVDVVLSATMGLHRSVEIAVVSDANDLSSEIRDAILAAIAAEQPGRFEVFNKPTNIQFSNLVYSSAIVFASSLAIVRHRRRAVKLESTDAATHSSSSPNSSVNGIAGSSGARLRSLRCKLRR